MVATLSRIITIPKKTIRNNGRIVWSARKKELIENFRLLPQSKIENRKSKISSTLKYCFNRIQFFSRKIEILLRLKIVI